MGEVSCEGSRMGSEVAIMAWVRALITFFGVDIPASKRVRKRKVYSQNTKKVKKSRRNTMVNCSCKWLNTAGGDHVRGGVLLSEISPRRMGVAQKWPKMIKARQQE